MGKYINGVKHELVGHINVDSGVIFVGDPCYVIGEDASHAVKDWTEFCVKGESAGIYEKGFAETLGEGVGVEISTLNGDGSYPVYVAFEENMFGARRPRSVFIDFGYDDEDDDE